MGMLCLPPLEVRPSSVAPGKSGLHARGEGERVLALESREGRPGARPGRPWRIWWPGHRLPIVILWVDHTEPGRPMVGVLPPR